MKAAAATTTRPLVVHLVHRFDTGGLENGIVNLINGMPAQAFRHAVVALTEVAPAFAQRIKAPDVLFHSLHKPPGQGARIFPALYTLLRTWRPAILHSRNLAPLECQSVAWAAGVPVRIHGEHGRDIDDPHGNSRRHRWMRRLYGVPVQQWIALSGELATYLEAGVGVPASRIRVICNGVDTARFSAAASAAPRPAQRPEFNDPDAFVIGTVGRMQPIKAQTLLVQAFVEALRQQPQLQSRLRLVLVGDGPLRGECQALLEQAGLTHLAWLPGERADVPEVMKGFDVFALPSLAEGISNTILEAMASGLPVLATAVGGNAELVDAGRTGVLVEPGNAQAMAQAIIALASDPAAARAMGEAGRRRAEQSFSLPGMVAAYQQLYEQLLVQRLPARHNATQRGI